MPKHGSRIPFKAHPKAIVESCSIGDGTRVWAFAHVMAEAVVGQDCNIGETVFVENGAKIGSRVTVKNGVQVWEGIVLEDDVFVGPNVTFANDRNPRSPRSVAAGDRYESKKWLEGTIVRKGAAIGANATILCGLEIGEYATIGAGSVVTRSVKPFELCYGSPAAARGHVCMCGNKLGRSGRGFACKVCGRAYIADRNGLRLAPSGKPKRRVAPRRDGKRKETGHA